LFHCTPQITNSVILEKRPDILDLSPVAYAGVFPKYVVMIAAKEV
jgi:predicted solute-binding protein